MECDKKIEIIRYLLDAWFDGETTCEQERRLKEYFMAEDVPADLLYAKAIFAGFSQAATEGYAGMPDLGREGECVCVAPAMEISETETADAASIATAIADASESASLHGRRRLRKIYTAVSVAASLTIALGLTWILVSGPKPEVVYCYVNGEPVTDMDIATRQAQMAARLIEGSVKASADGIAKVTEASKPIEQLGSTLRMLGMAEE